jgi:hypothetical protein
VRVAILGCGPAGLLSAYAAEQLGHNVSIFSRRSPSQIFGAMYLHAPIPGISSEIPELEIQVSKLGTREGYALNVYGDAAAPVSWDKFAEGPTPGWDLANVYDSLWKEYESRIYDVSLTSSSIRGIAKEYDITFSTVPIQNICDNWQHSFPSAKIWVIHGPVKGKNMMVYNGLPPTGVPSWYRYSLIRDYQSWEFSSRHPSNYLEAQRVAEGLQVSEGFKPLYTDCDCHPEIVRLGRFGKWNKNVFTHHAYREVTDALQ